MTGHATTTSAAIPREHVEWLVEWLSTESVGISSEALAFYGVIGRPVELRYGGDTYPADRHYLGLCERMYDSAPTDVQERMLPILERWRERLA